MFEPVVTSREASRVLPFSLRLVTERARSRLGEWGGRSSVAMDTAFCFSCAVREIVSHLWRIVWWATAAPQESGWCCGTHTLPASALQGVCSIIQLEFVMTIFSTLAGFLKVKVLKHPCPPSKPSLTTPSPPPVMSPCTATSTLSSPLSMTHEAPLTHTATYIHTHVPIHRYEEYYEQTN